MVDCESHVSSNWGNLYPYADPDGGFSTLSKQRAFSEDDLKALQPIDTAINNGCTLTDGVSVTLSGVNTKSDGTATVGGSITIPSGSVSMEVIVTVDGSVVQTRSVSSVSGTLPASFQNVQVGTGTHAVCLDVRNVTPA